MAKKPKNPLERILIRKLEGEQPYFAKIVDSIVEMHENAITRKQALAYLRRKAVQCTGLFLDNQLKAFVVLEIQKRTKRALRTSAPQTGRLLYIAYVKAFEPKKGYGQLVLRHSVKFLIADPGHKWKNAAECDESVNLDSVYLFCTETLVKYYRRFGLTSMKRSGRQIRLACTFGAFK